MWQGGAGDTGGGSNVWSVSEIAVKDFAVANPSQVIVVDFKNITTHHINTHIHTHTKKKKLTCFR